MKSDWLNTVDEGWGCCMPLAQITLLHLDTFHMNIEEPDCADSIRRARKVGHIHVADSDRWYPGHAHYDFESTFRALQEIGYRSSGPGVVSVPDPETAARRSLEVISPYASESMKDTEKRKLENNTRIRGLTDEICEIINVFRLTN